MNLVRTLLTLHLVALLFTAALQAAAAGSPRLDHLQIIGTHNSYHVAPHPSLDAWTRGRDPEQADSSAYTHPPLGDQLERLGIRQIELDVYADPEGGRFSEPAGARLALENGWLPVPSPDPTVMGRPGMKVLHTPDVDFQTTVLTLREALAILRTWSDTHPAHVPVFVLVELKSDVPAGASAPLPWTTGLLEALEQEILEMLPAHRLLRPDDVRETRRTLREAVEGRGWPLLAEVRGRLVFLLDNTDATRDLYLSRSATLAERLFFVSVGENHPAAAWFKVNDPVADFERIQRLVRQGYLVRTRADVGTVEARRQDPSRREAAFASGAQLISTDYPEPNPSWGDYRVRWTNAIVARANPLSAPRLPAELDLEELALRGLEPFAPRELVLLNQRAIRLHLQRRLDEASRDYARLLELAPPRPALDAEAMRIASLAPVLKTVSGEPFALEDVVAIHHPSRPLIAYHLFWDDDLDFPEDNDPTDHEIVWVEYHAGTGRPHRLFSYFHGQILEGAAPDDRPAFAVEWGKHGSLPLQNGMLATEPPALREHWERLSRDGTRLPEHPLARRWPRRYEGDWSDYRQFQDSIETQPFLESRRLRWISGWGNAVLDQFALPYNFAPKTEWP